MVVLSLKICQLQVYHYFLEGNNVRLDTLYPLFQVLMSILLPSNIFHVIHENTKTQQENMTENCSIVDLSFPWHDWHMLLIPGGIGFFLLMITTACSTPMEVPVTCDMWIDVVYPIHFSNLQSQKELLTHPLPFCLRLLEHSPPASFPDPTNAGDNEVLWSSERKGKKIK